jgi:hypothetical protein
MIIYCILSSQAEQLRDVGAQLGCMQRSSGTNITYMDTFIIKEVDLSQSGRLQAVADQMEAVYDTVRHCQYITQAIHVYISNSSYRAYLRPIGTPLSRPPTGERLRHAARYVSFVVLLLLTA